MPLTYEEWFIDLKIRDRAGEFDPAVDWAQLQSPVCEHTGGPVDLCIPCQPLAAAWRNYWRGLGAPIAP